MLGRKVPDDDAGSEVSYSTDRIEAALEKIAANQRDRHEPTIEEKILAITLCLNYAINESNVYWQRNAIYFTLNSILFGAVVAFPDQFRGVIMPLLGLLGIAFNWHWPHVNRYSKYFAERWREDARSIALEDDFLRDSLRTLLRKPRIAAPKGPLPSVVMNRLGGAFRLIWAAVLVIGLVQLSSQYADSGEQESDDSITVEPGDEPATEQDVDNGELPNTTTVDESVNSTEGQDGSRSSTQGTDG